MILHAVAVPVVPAVAWALVDLAVAVTFVVCLGLLWTWKGTIGKLFTWLGHKEISASVHGFGFKIAPFGFMLTLNEQAIGALDAAVAGTEHAMVYAFRRMVGAVLWTGQEISGLATDTYNAIKSMGHSTATTVTKVVRETVVKPITKTVTIVKGTSAVITRQLTARISRLEHRVASMAHATAGAIATPFPRIGHLEKKVTEQGTKLDRLLRQGGSLRARLHEIEKLLAGGAAVGLLVAALSRLGFGFIKCSGWQRVGRRITCGMSRFLESLLALAIDSLVITNLCEVTKLLTRVAVAAQPMLLKLTSGVEHLMECQGADAAPPLKFNGVAPPQPEKSVIQL